MKKPGVVLDVDGVLVKSGSPIDGACSSLERLRDANIPVCFCTNSCGTTEAKKAAYLSDILGFDIDPSAIVLSHTPAKSLLHELKSAKILASGSKSMVEAVRGYGFENVTHSTKFVDAFPEIFPERKRNGTAEQPFGPPLSKDTGGPSIDEIRADVDAPFEAVFVFQEPSTYNEDLQVIIDIVRFGGKIPFTARGAGWTDVCASSPHISTLKTKGNNDAMSILDDHGITNDNNNNRNTLTNNNDSGNGKSTVRAPVKVYYSNPDLVYQASFPVPRFTMGAFIICLRTLYQQIVGTSDGLEIVAFGKPLALTYDFVKETLEERGRDHGVDVGKIYAVGDNPKSDIRGANMMGWVSVLTRTGVFVGQDNDERDPADHVVADINEAVDIILRDQ